MIQATFIPDADDFRRGPRTGTRGRGATPPVCDELTADRPNPMGRRTLKLDFRPLKDDDAAVRDPFDGTQKAAWRVAVNLLWYYFRCIGGFQTIDDELLRLWAGACRRMEPQRIVWAIEAKAETLRPDATADAVAKRKFIGDPRRFVMRTSLECWSGKHPDSGEDVELLISRPPPTFAEANVYWVWEQAAWRRATPREIADTRQRMRDARAILCRHKQREALGLTQPADPERLTQAARAIRETIERARARDATPAIEHAGASDGQ